MRGGAEFEEVDLRGARIGGLISLYGSTFNSINLTGANVHEEFALFTSDYGATKWKNEPSMILRNTKIGTLQDSIYSWPENLVLEGFVYDRLGEFYYDEDNKDKETETRDIAWLEKWLNKQEKYSPQPYEHLAGVLRKTGHESMSNNILYAGMERKRKEATWMYWFGLTLLKIFIGYGYRIFYSLIWVIVFGAIGTLFIRFGKKSKEMKFHDCIFYSLDLLLPIIKLDERHYKIELEGPARFYFYFHIVMGFILASFVVAGISGLVQ